MTDLEALAYGTLSDGIEPLRPNATATIDVREEVDHVAVRRPVGLIYGC